MKLCSVMILVAFGGCALPDAEPDLGQVEQHAGCPSWKCGENSPLIDSFGFHELSLDGVVNAEGFRYVGFTKNGTNYDLRITNGWMTAQHGVTILGGNALKDSLLWVTYGGQTTYAIKIQAVDTTFFWAVPSGGTYLPVQTFTLQWTMLNNGALGKWADLCAFPPNHDDTLGMDVHDTLIFEGDRIDAKSKTITGYDSRWINFGCAGSTLAKLHLTGHTEAAGVFGFPTKVEQRQTMLKMLSADYCGDGTPFTVAGMPLQWADDNGWMKIGAASDLEARWGPRGATCLMKPRVGVNPTELASDTFPDIEAAIASECKRPPPCGDGTLDVGPEHLLSANPVLP